ncbi:Ldh family oxidoreductase [Paenibacillus piri]|uniref:Ldh family oxidoreductase n=1 Tax=Paenibacillus piri TaxID=2547395 RepID=A0A4R5KBC3_9BACL|nr:Ldh family oxidoreductase [Paenibacillus piri]TDF91818.1 Ldh family oxidoreductase [Paenibacillus piri]
MTKVFTNRLERFTQQLLKAAGLNDSNAATVTDVFMRATLRDVGHHDIYELPGRIDGLLSGKVKANPEISLIHSFGALENYEGDQGLGELCASFVMKRAEQLAERFGIGLCSIRNTHHILASAPYVEASAEKGYIGYIITRGAPTMGAPGRKEKVIGTSPMGYAVPTDKGYPLMFDACLAYTSNGVLAEKIQAGERVPIGWGLDAEGNPTDDPAAIAKGTRLPMGGHKGFGLTLLGEVLTGILSEGQIVDEPQSGTGVIGVPSHTALCIKADGLFGADTFKRRVSEIIDRMERRASGLQVPGQGSHTRKMKIICEGAIDLKEELVNKLNERARSLQLETLA